MKILLRYVAAIAVAMMLVSSASANLLTEWDFNESVGNPGNASTGTGTTSGSAFPFSTSLPNNSGSSADPASGIGNNSNALRSAPDPGEASGTRQIKWFTNAGANTDVTVTWDMTAGYRTSRFYQMSVTTDGTTFSPVSGGVVPVQPWPAWAVLQ